MPTQIRVNRIAERIHEELSELLLFQIKDPRVAGANVTDVEVDRELAYADIYVSALEGESRAEEILAGLRSAAGFIRSHLSKTIKLRTFPEVRFHWDPTPERADRIDQLLNSLRSETDEEEADEEAA
jgi:ribosome-binding factor A